MLDFWTVIYLLIVGLVAGYIARLVLRRTGNLGVGATLLAGIVGSFVGGLLGYVLFGWDEDEGWLQPGGVVGSIIGAIVVLAVWRWWTERSAQQPGAAPRGY